MRSIWGHSTPSRFLENKSKAMKKILSLIVAILAVLLVFLFFHTTKRSTSNKPTFWEVKSVDNVKYSRDLAWEKLEDASFDKVIKEQTKAIAATGATHIALGTPYDEKFLPFLER